MIPHLSVAANFFIGREISNGVLLSDREMVKECRKVLLDLNIDIDPETIMRELTVGTSRWLR